MKREDVKTESAAAQRTRQKLKDALIELCGEKGRPAVTVSAIAKRVGCNRCTFYNYYDDINGLLNEVENEVFDRIKQYFSDIFESGIPKSIEEIFPDMFSAFSDVGEKIFILVGEGGDVAFREKLCEAVKPFHRAIAGKNVDDDTLEYIGAFIASAMLGLAEQWHKLGKNIPNEYFVKLAQSLVFNGVKGTILENTAFSKAQ